MASQDRIKDFVARYVLHPGLGMTLGTWWDLLRRHRFAVDLVQQPRALIQTGLGAANSVVARVERRVHGPRIAATVVEAPVFILGHYRSGTTHLHNLLALDPTLAAPTLFQTLNPHTFLLTERLTRPLADRLVVRRRFQDAMTLDPGVASEDEMALGTMTGLSPYLAYFFPKDGDRYDRYLTLRTVPEADLARWREALTTFLRKLTLAHGGRRLVLKSPPHTARVGLILDLFPDARFVHIHRHPYEVFASTGHMTRSIQPAVQLQRCPPLDSPDRILRIYREMYDAYFAERDLIPAGRLVDVAYDRLRRDPIGVIGSIYDGLNLAGFADLRPQLDAYLGSIAGYRPNRHADLAAPLRDRIAAEWGRSFDEWGYAR